MPLRLVLRKEESTNMFCMPNSLSRVLLITLTSLLIAALPIAAQTATGSITGVIHDPTGGVIPNAKVTLINVAQGAGSARERTTTPARRLPFTPVWARPHTVTGGAPGVQQYT